MLNQMVHPDPLDGTAGEKGGCAVASGKLLPAALEC